MSQQIKKKFLSNEIISYFDDQIIAVDGKIDQEILDRESAVSGLQTQIDNLGTGFATDLELAAEVTARENADSALDLRIDALEADKEIIEVDTIGEAPSIGLEGKVYVDKDTNKIYRWGQTGGGSLTFQRVVGAGEAYATLQDALVAAIDGENILVKPGTYSVSSVINVTKKVKIVGENVDTVIFQTAGTTSDPVNMFNISVDDVALAKMTIKHRKTSNTSVEAAIVASGSDFPQTRIKNFILEQCKIEYAEFGLTVRAETWCVRDSQFTYATGTTGNSNRCIGVYGTKGNAFIKSNHFKNDVLNGTAFRPIYLTSTTGSNPNETVEGKLVIESNTHVGLLHQFYNQDNQQGSVDSFSLQIKSNVINETSLFAGFFAAVANSGNMFSSIALANNTCSFLHGGTPVGGKGMFAVDGSVAFRSSALTLHESGNVFTNSTYRTDYTSVEGQLVGRANTVSSFSVSKNSSIPASGDVPSAITTPLVGGYEELSPAPDLTEIESDISALQSSVSAIESDYVTSEELSAAIDAIPEVDLSGYYTKSEVDSIESGLQSAIDAEKGRIDAILDLSEADKDSFAELVTLINSIDTENDTAFAGYVLSNDAAVSGLDSRLDTLEPKVTALEAKGFANGSAVIGANLEYVDLDREYSFMIYVSNGRLLIHENEGYTKSVVAGKTRLTWIGSIAHPSGAEKIETGDTVFWTGAY